MSEKLKYYSKSVAATFASRTVAQICSLIIVVLLNRIIGKEQYGTYVFVASALVILGIMATAGVDRAILFRFSRAPDHRDPLSDRAIINFALVSVLLNSLVWVLVFFGVIYFIDDQIDLPNIIFWAVTLSLRTPFIALSQIFSSWYQARRLVAPAVLVPTIDPIVQLALLSLVLFAFPAIEAVAAAVIAGSIVPPVVWLILAPKTGRQRFERLTSSDVTYGIKMMLTSVTHRGVQRIDILMVGLLATSSITAEYAVAARLAIFVAIGNELLAPAFTPRMGRLIAGRQISTLLREYEQNRLVALSVAILAGAFFALLGPYLLAIIGEYQESQPILLILSAAHVIAVGFGANGRYLAMAGYGTQSLVTTLIMLTAAIVLNLLLIPVLGGEGAALGTLLSLLGVNAYISLLIWRLDDIATMSWVILAIIAAAGSLLLLGAFDVIGEFITVLVLLCVLGILLAHQMDLWLAPTRRLWLNILKRKAVE